ncbi:MAG: hypothetical protein Q8M98_10580 [Candidatus Cloacimonadaceae bacterium]|nr:hypothetical protein [Candidatus Cloacimonadaceae bacterium]
MNNKPKLALVFRMVSALREKGNWTGETSIHKSIYILQKLMNVPIDYEFTLYLHGPFSFDLRDVISMGIAYDYLAREYVSHVYGPKYQLTDLSRQFLKCNNELIDQYSEQVNKVCDIVSDKGVGSLEKLATALYAIKELKLSQENAIKKLHALKPHISIEEATIAVKKMQELIKDNQQPAFD